MQVKVYCTKRLLKNGIWKNTKHLMMVIHIKVTLSKGISFCLTRFGQCVMRMTPPLILIDSSKRKGNAKRGSEKYFGRK